VSRVAILANEPNDLARPVHDRMPVILKPGAGARLDPQAHDPDQVMLLVGPYPAGIRAGPALSGESRAEPPVGPAS
jgi:putative SOS response-associated peptidase YedK